MTDWTTDDIPDQRGRTVLITGANSGIGFEAAKALVDKGAHVVLGCRSVAKAEAAVTEIEAGDPSGSTEILELDLADLGSVEQAANTYLADNDRLDALINNAGLMATPKRLTEQGVEMQFGVNHLGHFALTGHLLGILNESGSADEPARVVSVSSTGHRPGKIDFDNLDASKSYSPWRAYFRSKLANLLFTNELQRRVEAADLAILATAAHPGGSDTNLGNEPAGDILSRVMRLAEPVMSRVALQSAAMGALPTLRAAIDPAAAGGDYFGPDGIGEMRGHPKRVDTSSRAKDADVAGRLWEVSSELSGVDYLA